MSYSSRSPRVRSAGNSHSSRGYRSQRPASRKKVKTQYIDPSRFIKSARPVETEAYQPQHSFADFALSDLLKNNLAARGYTTPSPIQDQAIPLGLAGKDVIGVASTGTGKTAAFVLPVLQRLMSDPNAAALIVAPTRELAQQIDEECRLLGRGSRIFGVLLIGGASMGRQLHSLRQRPRIVIGTPGRIKDHLQRGTLRLESFNIAVLDEVDRVLDMGFVNSVTEILTHLHSERQSFFFSATIENRVRTLIDTFANNPEIISLKASSASENVHQNVVRFADKADKIDKLHDLLNNEQVKKAIIFDDTRWNVERLSKELVARGFAADSIHGGKSQGQRQRALARLKSNEISILVATDVAARGIDVVGISHVVNYSVPKMYDDYIHRIGRAGRAGNIGHALTFISH